MCGDFLSPSALGSAVVGDGPLNGRQMVWTLNAMGLDYAALGNHEFDYPTGDPIRRAIAESDFRWIASNVTIRGLPEYAKPKIVATKVHQIAVKGRSEPLRVGLFGVTFHPGAVKKQDAASATSRVFPESDKPADQAKVYAEFRPPLVAAREMVAKLKQQKADVIIALTHLNLQWDPQEQGDPYKVPDEALAREPGIDLILGGHEHANNFRIRMDGRDLPPIFKADANARTVFVHHLHFRYDPDQPETPAQLVRIDSEQRPITNSIDKDPATDAVAEAWFRGAWKTSGGSIRARTRSGPSARSPTAWMAEMKASAPGERGSPRFSPRRSARK